MIALSNRFEREHISLLNPVDSPMGTVYWNDERELLCAMPNGGTCGLGNDVFAFACDSSGVWYVTCEDIQTDKSWVYWLDAENVLAPKRGLLDGEGNFLFVEDNVLHRVDKAGKRVAVSDTNTLNRLASYENGLRPLTLAQIADLIATDQIITGKGPVEMYPFMLEMHRLVGELSHTNHLRGLSSSTAIRMILRLIAVCNRAQIDVQKELVYTLRRSFGLHIDE